MYACGLSEVTRLSVVTKIGLKVVILLEKSVVVLGKGPLGVVCVGVLVILGVVAWVGGRGVELGGRGMGGYEVVDLL